MRVHADSRKRTEAQVTLEPVRAEGSGALVAEDFQESVEERVVFATARAIATAVAQGGSDCRAGGDVCARTSPQCASANAKCGGDGFDHVLPCCTENYRCIVQTEDEYRCRHKSFPVLPGWIGTVADCTLPSPAP